MCTAQVRHESVADKAGVEEGDIVVAVDGDAVESGARVIEALKASDEVRATAPRGHAPRHRGEARWWWWVGRMGWEELPRTAQHAHMMHPSLLRDCAQVKLRIRKPEGVETKHLMAMLKQLHEQHLKDHKKVLKEKHRLPDEDSDDGE